jgi:hypothetical protein
MHWAKLSMFRINPVHSDWATVHLSKRSHNSELFSPATATLACLCLLRAFTSCKVFGGHHSDAATYLLVCISKLTIW